MEKSCNKVSYSLIFGLVLFFSQADSQIPIVKDISKIVYPNDQGAYPKNLTSNGTLLFFTGGGIEGRELWVTDGSATGTRIVKDIFPGMESSNPSMLTNVNGIIFFLATDGANGRQLWRSDGTSNGTFRISNLENIGDTYSVITNLTAVGSKLFFSDYGNGFSPFSLGVSDGTPEGTSFIANNLLELNDGGPLEIVEFMGSFYFRGKNGTAGFELWKTDGTAQGTTLAVDIVPGPSSSFPSLLKVFGGAIYFRARTGSTGDELMKSDGTASGTVVVKDINLGINDSSPSNLTAVGNQLYFTAYDGTRHSIWRTDGTNTGTIQIRDVNTVSNLTAWNDGIAFVSTTIDFLTIKQELWKSDGSTAGTVPIKQLRMLAGPNQKLVSSNGKLFFVGSDAPSTELNVNYHIWKTDGTSSGTVQVTAQPYVTGIGGLPPEQLISYSGKIYFAGMNGNNFELLATNGNVGNIELITNRPPVNSSSLVSWLTELNGQLVFRAGDENVGLELFKSDGTENGTFPIKDIYPGFTSSDPAGLYKWKNKIFFSAYTASFGREIWVSDGTAQGTNLLIDATPGVSSSFDGWTDFAANSNYVFFSNYSSENRGLWRTDGTTSGTILVKSTTSRFSSSSPDWALLNDNVFFTDGTGLWITDGTPQNTKLIKEVVFQPTRNNLLADGKFVYFKIKQSTFEELWITDGTVANTKKIQDFKSFILSSGMTTTLNSLLYFFADDGIHGTELWKTDGTSVGTSLVKDIIPGITSTTFSPATPPSKLMITYNEKVYFSYNDGEHGFELWASDGTPSGTRLVKDVFLGQGSSNPNGFIVIDGAIYFVAYDAINYSIWKTNGTECGTLKASTNATTNINPSIPILAIENIIFLSASDYIRGEELYKHDIMQDLPVSENCRQNQSMTFEALSDKTFGDTPFTLMGSSSASLPISYSSSNTAVATVSGNEVSIKGVGTTTIMAVQKGNAYIRPASSIERTLAVNKANQSITFQALPTKTFGEPSFALEATTSSGLPITYMSGNTLVATVVGNMVNIVGAGTATITASQAGNSNFNGATSVQQLLNVTKANQMITFGTLPTKTATDSPFLINASVSSNLPITFTSSNNTIAIVNGNVITIKAAGSCVITATQSGNANYNGAQSVSQQLLINKQNQTIAFGPLVEKTLGDVPFNLTATASSNLPVSYLTNSDKVQVNVTQVILLKAGRVSIEANQSGNNLFNSATSVSQSFCIRPSKPILTLLNANSVNPIIQSNTSVGNQWFFNDSLIPGANNATLEVTQSGSYKVQTQMDDCKSDFSDNQVVVITAIEPNQSDAIEIFPNPAANELTINVDGFEENQSILVSVLDYLGRNYYSKSVEDKQSLQLDLSSYPSGLYLIKFNQKEKLTTKSFVKID